MSRKTEQFLANLKDLPDDELQGPKERKVRVPKGLRRKTGKAVREIMRPDQSVSAPEHKTQIDVIAGEIASLQEQKKNFEADDADLVQIIDNAIQEKEKQLAEIEAQAETAPLPKPANNKREKRGAVKTAMIEIAENENTREARLEKVTPYLPDSVLDKVAAPILQTLGGREAVIKVFFDSYLNQRYVPEEMKNIIHSAETNIKIRKTAKAEKMPDAKVREQLLNAIKTGKVNSSELGNELRTRMSAGELNQAVIEYVIHEGTVDSEKLEQAILEQITHLQREKNFYADPENQLTILHSAIQKFEASKKEYEEADKFKDKLDQEYDRVFQKELARDQKTAGELQGEFQSAAKKLSELNDKVRIVENTLTREGEQMKISDLRKIAEQLQHLMKEISAQNQKLVEIKKKAEKLYCRELPNDYYHKKYNLEKYAIAIACQEPRDKYDQVGRNIPSEETFGVTFDKFNQETRKSSASIKVANARVGAKSLSERVDVYIDNPPFSIKRRENLKKENEALRDSEKLITQIHESTDSTDHRKPTNRAEFSLTDLGRTVTLRRETANDNITKKIREQESAGYAIDRLKAEKDALEKKFMITGKAKKIQEIESRIKEQEDLREMITKEIEALSAQGKKYYTLECAINNYLREEKNQ